MIAAVFGLKQWRQLLEFLSHPEARSKGIPTERFGAVTESVPGMQKKRELTCAIERGEREGSAIRGDPIGPGGREFRIRDGGAQGDNAGAGSFRGANAGGSIFEDDAVGGREAEDRSAFLEGLRIRFAALHIEGGDEVRRHGQAGSANAHLGERPCAGGHDGPAIGRERTEKGERAGQGNYAFEILNFAALDFAIFRGVVGMGKVFADGGQAGAALGSARDLLRVKAMFERPPCPHPGYGGRGVNEHAIQIEQESAAANLSVGHHFRLLEMPAYWGKLPEERVGWAMGFEPTTFGATVRCSTS